MKFYYRKAKELFDEEWQELKRIMLAEGIKETAVEKLYLEDWERVKKDRLYLTRKEPIEIVEGRSVNAVHDTYFDLIQFAENEALLTAIEGLTDYEKQIVFLRYEKQMKLSEIAEELGKGVSAIKEAHSQLIKKNLK